MPAGIHLKAADPASPDSLGSHLDGSDAVINLAGENIAAGIRWTRRQKHAIVMSRIDTVTALAAALQRCSYRPRTVIQASAIGLYGSRADEICTEDTPGGTGFLAAVAGRWEEAAAALPETGVRCVLIRTGIVLGPGGFLQRVQLPFRLFAGGHPGSGRQWISWIHLADEIGAIRFLLEQDKLDGPFNLTAPNPLTARVFFRQLGRVLHRPSWAHPPAAVLSMLMGAFARELLLSGQRVLPERLRAAGFQFTFPDAQAALTDLLS